MAPSAGKSVRVRSAPSAAISLARSTSSRALPLATNASVRFSRSSGRQSSGTHPASTNSSGSRARARPTQALMPRVKASATALVSDA
jgi:hypothetical protein